MGKKYKNLYDEITSSVNLFYAYERARCGKRYSTSHLLFKQDLMYNITQIGKELKTKTYIPSEPRHFVVKEPKPRNISALSFKDRIVHHSLCAVITPIFESTFLPCSYACRKGKGTHLTSKDLQAVLRKTEYTHYLKIDFSKYFHSVNQEILLKEIKRKISCKNTLWLIELILKQNESGIPIGNLTSQIFANIYGHIFDRWLIHEKKCKHVFRYMDDTIILGNEDELKSLFKDIEVFIENEMKLKLSKWCINRIDKGINFVGYRIWKTHKLIRKSSVKDARRKLRKLKGQDLEMFLASWEGHIRHANTYNLQKSLGLIKNDEN